MCPITVGSSVPLESVERERERERGGREGRKEGGERKGLQDENDSFKYTTITNLQYNIY